MSEKNSEDQDARNKMLESIHTKFRKECIENGTYKPITEDEIQQEISRHRKLCENYEYVAYPKRRRRKKR